MLRCKVCGSASLFVVNGDNMCKDCFLMGILKRKEPLIITTTQVTK